MPRRARHSSPTPLAEPRSPARAGTIEERVNARGVKLAALRASTAEKHEHDARLEAGAAEAWAERFGGILCLGAGFVRNRVTVVSYETSCRQPSTGVFAGASEHKGRANARILRVPANSPPAPVSAVRFEHVTTKASDPKQEKQARRGVFLIR